MLQVLSSVSSTSTVPATSSTAPNVFRSSTLRGWAARWLLRAATALASAAWAALSAVCNATYAVMTAW
jgi:hypothetical protein